MPGPAEAEQLWVEDEEPVERRLDGTAGAGRGTEFAVRVADG
ncbi:hypothetical protein ACKI2C_02085 [Streptomyces brasiliscabiei]